MNKHAKIACSTAQLTSWLTIAAASRDHVAFDLIINEIRDGQRRCEAARMAIETALEVFLDGDQPWPGQPNRDRTKVCT
jgi:hypothetical protein